jgi:hypothetical protein
MKKNIYLLFFILLTGVTAFAGNPDRQGEAGASELLFNPWARSAGLHSMSTSFVSGVDAMRINVAGIGRIEDTEFAAGNVRLYEGSELGFNAFGFVKKVGENGGAFGVSMAAVDFGDILLTTTDQPEGITNFSPSFFHIGLGYAKTYENKISVGLLVRGVFESITDVSASGFAIDAGVQYVSGENDEFKLGISLRNVGSPMRFSGEGLALRAQIDGEILSLDQRAARFEMPSALNIGISYDFAVGTENVLRGLANFTSNAFSRDQIGLGAELIIFKNYIIRGGYKLDFGDSAGALDNIYTGGAAGFTANLPISSEFTLGLDYAYRTTNPFRGSHNFTVRVGF